MTYCVHCGSDNTAPTETGNEGYLFAGEDSEGSIEYYSDLELWQCNSDQCKQQFFK